MWEVSKKKKKKKKKKEADAPWIITNNNKW